MTTDLEINLPCTKHTDGSRSCLAQVVPETEQEQILEACDNCKAGYTITSLMMKLKAYEGRPPTLLICVDCKNTTSPAAAMARQHFNPGRCMCGGFFKVFRA